MRDKGSVRTRCDRLGRVFYRICQDAVSFPEDYALNKARWFNDVCIYSFAFNLWAADTRSLEERQKDPCVLDVGWTEFDSPTDSDDLRAVSTTHLFLEENRLLMNKGRKRLVCSAANLVPFQMVLNLYSQVLAGCKPGHAPRFCSATSPRPLPSGTQW